MNPIFSKFLAPLVLACLAGFSSARAADWVVLETTDTTAEPQRGGMLSGDHQLELPSKDRIVLIHRDGTLLRIAGPYSGDLG